MSNRLNLPKDLTSLIEKREQEDRRQQDTEASGEAPAEERRSGKDRRQDSDSDS